MAGLNSPVMVSLPGYNPSRETFPPPDDSANQGMPSASAYKLPPAILMIALLIGGYLGLRWIMEES